VLALLYEICRRRGRTLIVATHSDEVLGLADRVLTINNARLEEARR
jgi:putative ABC transport system ATP-binding protein